MSNISKIESRLREYNPDCVLVKIEENKCYVKLKCGHIRIKPYSHLKRKLYCKECGGICAICGKEFKDEVNLKKHEFSHTQILPSSFKEYSIEDWQREININNPDVIVKGMYGEPRNRRLNIGFKTCNHETSIVSTNLKRNIKCNICARSEPNTFSSKSELELLKFIKSLYPDARKTYVNEFMYEIDIYIPSLRVGFEYNGSYWHSLNPNTRKTLSMGKYTHRNKQEYMLNNYGIRIYYLWEYWSLDKCKNIIKAKLGKTKKLYGPKLELREVDTKTKKRFFDSIHVDNDCKSCYNLGLYKDNKLVECMSFRKNNFSLEVARLATIPNISVIEGVSILLNKGIEYAKSNGYKDILSYCLRDLAPSSENAVYFKLGFILIGDSGPTMKYYNKNTGLVEPRQKYQKHKLKDLFPNTFSEQKTELEILEENKIYPIYDSGNWKFIKEV